MSVAWMFSSQCVRNVYSVTVFLNAFRLAIAFNAARYAGMKHGLELTIRLNILIRISIIKIAQKSKGKGL